MAIITRTPEAAALAASIAAQAARKAVFDSHTAARIEAGETPDEGTEVVPVQLTQAEYDAIPAPKDPDKLYVIVG